MHSATPKKEQVLRVHIIDDVNTKDFEQLKVLMKKFQIDAYIRGDLRFCDLDRSEQNRVINSTTEEFNNSNFKNQNLKQSDIKKISEIIENKIKQMEEEILKPNCRIYVLKDGDKVVAFQYAHIEKEGDEKIEGHIAMSYTEPEYRRKGLVETMYGETKEGSFSKLLIEQVEEWFHENGVTHEEIGAGENVFYNMETYVTKWGFIPNDRINGTIYMEKDLKNPIKNKDVLKEIFNMCVYHRKRKEEKTAQNIESQIDGNAELQGLPNEVKKNLIKVFLKDDEKKEEKQDLTVFKKSNFFNAVKSFIKDKLENFKAWRKKKKNNSIIGLDGNGLNKESTKKREEFLRGNASNIPLESQAEYIAKVQKSLQEKSEVKDDREFGE